MNVLSFFTRKRSAPMARDRLQVLLAHERALSGRKDLAAILQREILEVTGLPPAPALDATRVPV